MGKIRVLEIAGNMHVGGIENQLMHLLRNADKDKFQIDFTSTMPGAFYREEIEKLGGKFILIPKMSWRKPLEYCKAIYKVMKDGQYDIVHSHELFHSGITVLIAYLAGVPCRFVHAHNWQDGDGSGKKRSIVRTIYNMVMRILIWIFSTDQIACSTLAGEFVFGKKTLKKGHYHLVYNSVDTSQFLEKYGQAESGEFCDGDWYHVLHVGRVTPVKNQMFLAKMAYIMKKRGDHIRILCAGTGDEDYVSRVQAVIDRYQLHEYIKLLGVRKDIDELMRKANAFILPSHYEGMPLVLIEAQASGLLCLAADTFSHEVDFGIGLIRWLSLDQKADIWVGMLEKAVKKERAEKVEVEKAIAKGKYDSKMFADTVCGLYEDAYYMQVT